MTNGIQKIERNQLCIIHSEPLNLLFIAWALSKGYNAIYIEKENKALEIISLLDFNLLFAKPNSSMAASLYSISHEDYAAVSSNPSSLFQHTESNFIPIIKNNQIEGELIKSPLKPPNFPKIYWPIITDNTYKYFLSKLGRNILFASLDKCTYGLYNILKRLNSSNLTILDTSDVSSQDNSYDLVIFHTNSHHKKHYCIGKTHYLTTDYIYFQLLVISVLNFYKENNISFYYLQLPPLNNLPPSIKDNLYPYDFAKFVQDTEALDKYYGTNHNRKYFENGDYKKVAIIDKGLRHYLRDFTSETANVIDGKRLTIGTPVHYSNSIHCFGPCIVRGGYVCDDSTICSYLQQYINNQNSDWIRVLNYGVEGGVNSIYDFHNMMSATYKPNDIVILFSHLPHEYFLANELKFTTLDPSPIYTEENLKYPCIINSMMHVTHRVNKLLAEYLYGVLKPNLSHLNPQIEAADIKMNIDSSSVHLESLSPAFTAFKTNLIKYRIPDYLSKKIGAIVMNCNPFTLGHLYLVEESLKYVDHLYVFIVEEDKSFFSFEERYNLAKLCCSHLKKVTILPSGKYIISAATFPEYFFKEQMADVIINPSKDVELFGNEIAPVLNITYRFLGEEPIDKITAQYNLCLKEELKWFSIQVIEIPRKCVSNQLISASYVRQLIKDNNVKATHDFLPPQTYNYICNKFKS